MAVDDDLKIFSLITSVVRNSDQVHVISLDIILRGGKNDGLNKSEWNFIESLLSRRSNKLLVSSLFSFLLDKLPFGVDTLINTLEISAVVALSIWRNDILILLVGLVLPPVTFATFGLITGDHFDIWSFRP